jgi:transposase
MIAWTGIDVAKKTLVVCLVRDGHKPCRKEFENSQVGFAKLVAWVSTLVDPKDCHFCMESTGVYSFSAACFLAGQDFSVTVENPRRIKHFAIAKGLKCKTDKVDAHSIAEYAKSMQPRLWHLKDPARREMSILQARQKQIQEMRQMELNRLENPCLPALMKTQIQEHVELLDKQEQAIIDTYPELLAKCETVKTVYDAITKIKGIGHECGLLFACEIDVFSFDEGKYVASYAGLSPRLNESGTFRGRSRITKEGHSRIRRCFFMATRSAVRFNPLLKEFFERLRERGLTKKQAYIAVARKLLIYCYGIAKKALQGQMPIYPGGECQSRKPWSKEIEQKFAETLTC